MLRDMRWVQDVDRFLERAVVRLVLSIAIIVSLLPFDWVEGTESVFFALFGTEFVARLFVVFGRPIDPDEDAGSIVERPSAAPRSGRSRGGGIFLLFIDLVALISFLPLGPRGHGGCGCSG